MAVALHGIISTQSQTALFRFTNLAADGVVAAVVALDVSDDLGLVSSSDLGIGLAPDDIHQDRCLVEAVHS